MPQSIADITKNIEKTIQRAGRFTVQDISALSGVAVFDVKAAMNPIMEKFQCRLLLTESGELIYDFSDQLTPRNKKTFREYWDQALTSLWKAFVFLFKIWITLTLIVYFIVFVVILIALLVMLIAKSSSSDSDDDDSIGNLVGLIGRALLELVVWKSTETDTQRKKDEYGYDYREYKTIPPALDSLREEQDRKNKKWNASIFDFVFGQPRVELHPLANQMEVAAFLREEKGIVVLSEIKALAGWDTYQAEKFFSECLYRFDGTPEVSENSILYGNFNAFSQSARNWQEGKVVWFWDEYEPPYELTGNLGKRNTMIVFMNTFNLLFSGLILLGASQNWPLYQELFSGIPGIPLLLGWIPLLFSTIFFLVPLMRKRKIRSLNKKRQITNIQKRLLKAIFSAKGNALTLDDMQRIVNQSAAGEESLSKETIESTMNSVIADYNGEAVVDKNNQMVYSFPTLKAELAEAALLRNQISSRPQTGKIIMDSGAV